MNIQEAKALIPVYIGISEVQEILGVGRRTAEKVYKELKEENKNKPTPNSRKIPLDWLIKKYGIKQK